MNKIESFIKNRRKEEKILSTTEKLNNVPWYRRQLDRKEFTYNKGQDGKFYIQHNEWHKTIFVGPYKTVHEAEDVINSYIAESKKINLDKKVDSRVHSVQIENYNEFFKNN